MKKAIVSALLMASLPAFAQSDMFERDRQLYESSLPKRRETWRLIGRSVIWLARTRAAQRVN